MKKLFLSLLAIMPFVSIMAQDIKSGDIIESESAQTTSVISLTESLDGIDIIEVNVKTAGTLASRILMKDVELEDVQGLKVTGTLNDEDWKVIKNNLTSLIYLDISGTNVTSVPAEEFKSSIIIKVILPETMTSIGDNAFDGSNLADINMPERLTTIGRSAFYKTKIKGEIVIPSTVTSLGQYAFAEAVNITKLVVKKGCKSLPSYLCNNCTGITEIDIPSSVESIGSLAFAGCTNLNILKMHHTNPINMDSSYSYDTFYKLDKSKITLYVPLYSSTKYINHSYWSAFKKIREKYAFLNVKVDGSGGEVCIADSTVRSSSGTVSIETELMNDIKIELKPDFGYIVSKVLLNNEDITSKTENEINIEEIDDNYSLSVTFDYDKLVVNGLTYAVLSQEDKTAILIEGSEPYTGDIVIAENITYKGENYKVTAIDYKAFNNNQKITSVIISNTIKEIADNSFYGCSSLNSVTIGSSVTKIQRNAFESCRNVKKLIYADGCTKTLRTGLKSITSVTIPNSVTSIGSSSFSGCSSLTSFTIPNSVTSIGGDAFDGCTSLKSIVIGNSVKEIGQDAFEECTSLVSITFPASLEEISDDGIFYGCTNLEEINVDENNKVYSSLNGVLFNKDKTILIQCPNGKAGEYSIPTSVVTIEDKAFRSCTRLTSVIIPNSVTSIGYSAFRGCTGLTSVIIPNSVTSIGSYAFQDCTGLTSISIPNSVTNIGSYAFSGCTSLISIKIPSSVKNIDRNIFSDCSSLTTIEVDDNNNYYSSIDGVLFNKNKSEIIFCPEGKSGQYTIPNSVTNIGNYAFSGCKGLTSITIPNSVTSIGYSAFYGCTGLTSISIPNSVTSIGSSAFSVCTGLTSISISNSVTSIGSSAFFGCTGLTSVIIPNSVTSIGYNAFENCSSLTSLTIPESVTNISSYAFRGCNALKSIYNFAKKPQSLYSSPFSSYTATLYVFPGCKDAYSSADVWKNFTIVEKDMITGVEEVKVAESNDSSYVIYDVNGKIVSSLKHGVNILRYANGKVKKVMIK